METDKTRLDHGILSENRIVSFEIYTTRREVDASNPLRL